MASATRLTQAQIRFLSGCVADPNGQSLRPGQLFELAGKPAPKGPVQAWYRTARALIARGLLEYGSSHGYILGTITQAGREALGKAMMQLKNVETYEAWKLGCVAAVIDVGLSVDDLWDKDDPYDLFSAADAAYKAKSSPMSFIEGIFAEDLARHAYDDHLAEEAMQYEFEEG